MRKLHMGVWLVLLSLLTAIPTGAAKLTVWTMPHAGNPRWYTAGAEEFAESRSGVEVEVISGWLDKLFTLVAAGEAPDVISYSSSELAKLIPLNMVADLSDYISRDSGFNLSQYFPPAVDALKYRGRLYGLPRQWSVVGLIYNIDRLEERGVRYPSENWTWDDLVTNGKKLTYSTTGTNIPDHYAFGDTLRSHHRQPIWVLEAGGDYWNEDYTKCLLDSPKAERGLQFFVDLITHYNIAPDTQGAFSDPGKAFSEGRVAMTHNTRFYRPSNPNFRWGVAPVVKGPTGRHTLTIVDFVSVSSVTKYPDLTWELAKYYASEPGFQAGMELEPKENYFWGLSPFKRQALRQLEQNRDYGDSHWLTMLDVSRPAPTFHPAGVNAVPDLALVVRGQMSLRALLENSVRQWNQQVAEAQAKGVKW